MTIKNAHGKAMDDYLETSKKEKNVENKRKKEREERKNLRNNFKELQTDIDTIPLSNHSNSCKS